MSEDDARGNVRIGTHDRLSVFARRLRRDFRLGRSVTYDEMQVDYWLGHFSVSIERA